MAMSHHNGGEGGHRQRGVAHFVRKVWRLLIDGRRWRQRGPMSVVA